MTNNPTILITRPEPQATRFQAELRDALGDRVQICVVPMFEYEFSDGKIDGSDAGVVAFTSEAAVIAADRQWSGRRTTAYAVGPRTADAARAAGWQVVQGTGTATDLAKRILSDPVEGPVLWVRGRDARPGFGETLQRGGIEVAENIAYAVKKTPVDSAVIRCVRRGGAVWVPVFSPNAGARLKEILGETISKIRIVAISESAARPVSGAKEVHICGAPNGTAMLNLLISAINTA